MAHTSVNAPTLTVSVDGTPFVYRRIGTGNGVPIVFFHHFTAVLDDWDPKILDGLAAEHPVIIFDNRGVGGSEGVTPPTVEEMADDAALFIRALDLEKVDVFGFSLGGFVAQAVLLRHPDLVRRAILTGTGPKGGVNHTNAEFLGEYQARAQAAGKHIKNFLFFSQSEKGQRAADRFLMRLTERTVDRDKPVSEQTMSAHLQAIDAWGFGAADDLSIIKQPVFVANGDKDEMVATELSFDLSRRLPHVQLSIFPDAGHGGIFEYHSEFVAQALTFLQ